MARSCQVEMLNEHNSRCVQFHFGYSAVYACSIVDFSCPTTRFASEARPAETPHVGVPEGNDRTSRTRRNRVDCVKQVDLRGKSLDTLAEKLQRRSWNG
jgi:hypothetical protein